MSATHVFQKYTVDGVDEPNNPASLVITKDTSIVAHYINEETGLATLSGTVTQAAPRLVTIVVTKVGGAAVTQTTTTLANGTYSTTFTGVAGSYTAVASVAADATHQAASSPTVPFTISLLPTTITLTVT